jgi:hypothetical protein
MGEVNSKWYLGYSSLFLTSKKLANLQLLFVGLAYYQGKEGYYCV